MIRRQNHSGLRVLGEAVVGDQIGETLAILPFQLITFSALKEKYPDAFVLSRDTGFSRQYGVSPYSGYENRADLLFPVRFQSEVFFAKELMYVVPFDDLYYTMPYAVIPEGESVFSDGRVSFAVLRDGDEIVVTSGSQRLVGYFELWFSFYTHHRDDGVVLHAEF